MDAGFRVFLVDDDRMFREMMGREIAHMGYRVEVEASGLSALTRLKQNDPPFDVIVLDVRIPDLDGVSILKEIKRLGLPGRVVMLTGHGTITNAVEAMKLGAVDYLTKPCSLDDVERTLQRAAHHAVEDPPDGDLQTGEGLPHAAEFVLGKSDAIRPVLDLVTQVAPSDSTILIYGESGVGKEVIARAIHRGSHRRKAPFVVIDCTSLQESLLESELFGHERGAYTGATSLKHGLFEVADTGTVLLDELSEVSIGIQAKLLRALETGTFRRIGGTSDIRVNVRLLGTTNRRLDAMVTEGLFRKDLFYRLNVVSITVPPLRERPEDIPELAQHFLARTRGGDSITISAEALEILRLFHWPGNVRELKHVIERAALLCGDGRITPADLPVELHAGAPSPRTRASLREAERVHVERVLRSVGGRRADAARILGISERQLYRKLRAFGLSDGSR